MDLAAGTGEVAKLLATRGFTKLTVCDQSPRMLDVAKLKLSGILPLDRFFEAAIQALPFSNQFHGIICRQAINYLPPEDLTSGLANVRQALRPEGEFHFNTFDPEGVHTGLARSDRTVDGTRVILTREGNLLREGRVLHGQRTEIFDSTTGDYELVYDFNSFWGYTRERLERAANSAGFSFVESSRRGNSLYFRCRR